MRNILLGVCLFLCSFMQLHANQPHRLSFQGVLNNQQGTAVVDSNYIFNFSIYDAEMAGNKLWEESKLIQTHGGAYQTVLGNDSSMNALPFDQTYYVQVMVNNTLLPTRSKLTPVPYALSANNVTGSIAQGLAVKSLNGLTDGVKIKTAGLIELIHQPDSNAILLVGTAQAVGPVGPKGDKGDAGVSGGTGLKGDKGDDGYGLKIDDTCDSTIRANDAFKNRLENNYTCIDLSSGKLYLFKTNGIIFLDLGVATVQIERTEQWDEAYNTIPTLLKQDTTFLSSSYDSITKVKIKISTTIGELSGSIDSLSTGIKTHSNINIIKDLNKDYTPAQRTLLSIGQKREYKDENQDLTGDEVSLDFINSDADHNLLTTSRISSIWEGNAQGHGETKDAGLSFLTLSETGSTRTLSERVRISNTGRLTIRKNGLLEVENPGNTEHVHNSILTHNYLRLFSTTGYDDVLIKADADNKPTFEWGDDGDEVLSFVNKYCLNGSCGTGRQTIMQLARSKVTIIPDLQVNGSIQTADNIYFGNSALATGHGGSIELGSSGTPYFDFHNDNDPNNDYDIRLRLMSDNELRVEGGNLNVEGQVQSYGTVLTSDRRYKQNITQLTGSLNKITSLNGYSYNWKQDEFPEKNFSDKKQLGLIAQEVIDIVPEAVHEGDDGYYSVDYQKMIPLLIEAIKEQQAEINDLKEAISQQTWNIIMKLTKYLYTLLLLVAPLLANQPHRLSFQGVLNNQQGTAVVDSNYIFNFSIYDDEKAGNKLWEESKLIQTHGGAYQTILGNDSSMHALPFDQTYYVQVMVNNTLLPTRSKLTPVPYALSANNVTGNIAPGLAVKSLNGLTDGVLLDVDGMLEMNKDPVTNTITLIGKAPEIGPQGLQGVQGIQGVPGEDGEPGIKGDRGDNGYGLAINDTCDTGWRNIAKKTTDFPIEKGDVCLDITNNNLYMFHDSPKSFINVGQATARDDQIQNWNSTYNSIPTLLKQDTTFFDSLVKLDSLILDTVRTLRTNLSEDWASTATQITTMKNVGIGTTTPSSSLTIKGTANNSWSQFKIERDSDSDQWGAIQAGGNDMTFVSAHMGETGVPKSQFRWITKNSDQDSTFMTLSSKGALLLGTTISGGGDHAGYKQTLYSDTDRSYSVYQTNSTGTGGDRGVLVGYRDTQDDLPPGLMLWNREATNAVIATNAKERIRVDQYGNIAYNGAIIPDDVSTTIMHEFYPNNITIVYSETDKNKAINGYIKEGASWEYIDPTQPATIIAQGDGISTDLIERRFWAPANSGKSLAGSMILIYYQDINGNIRVKANATVGNLQ